MNRYFDNRRFKAVEASKGVKIDSLSVPTFETDIDMMILKGEQSAAFDAPLTILETTGTTAGDGSITLNVLAPIVAPAMAVPVDVRVFCIDLQLQLNALSNPATAFRFVVEYLDVDGNVLAYRTQNLSGQIFIQDGTTRTLIRLFPTVRNFTVSPTVLVNQEANQDGAIFLPPVFKAFPAAFIAAYPAGVGFTSVAKAIAPDAVSAIRISAAAGGFSAGIQVTATVLTGGRQDWYGTILSNLADVADQLDEAAND